MADLAVAILGLGRLGTSAGLALKRYNDMPRASNHFTVTGHDMLGPLERTAKTLGAVDQTTASARAAVTGKDMVLLAVPYAEFKRTLQDIAPGLREGAVVLDLSPLKQRAIDAARDLLPEGVFLISGTAVVNPIYLWDGLDDTEHARADYFDNGAVLLAPDAAVNPEAIDLVTAFINVLGADVHYVDPAEHDGVIAATEAVPALLGLAAFRAMSSGDGWGEVQRLTNPAFGRLTHRIMDTHPDDLRDLLVYNRDNTVRHLDAVLATLTELRELLNEGDSDAIEAALVNTEKRYQAWIKQRSQGKWDDALDQDAPDNASILSGFLGGFLSERLFGGKDDDEKGKR